MTNRDFVNFLAVPNLEIEPYRSEDFTHRRDTSSSSIRIGFIGVLTIDITNFLDISFLFSSSVLNELFKLKYSRALAYS